MTNPLQWASRRVRAIVVRRRLERDMQEEMRWHLEQTAERLVARGMSPADARIAARREFGNVALLQEEARDVRHNRWIGDLIGDLRFAFRYFARNKRAAATIVTILALGIGSNAAFFSVLRAWLVRPAPAVPKDHAHARIYGLEQPSRSGRWSLRGFSYPEVIALREQRQTFADVAAWVGHDVVLDLDDSTGARGVAAEFVTPNFFGVLGVPIVAGPGFVQHAPDVPDMAAVLTYAKAAELYGAPANAIGKRVLINEVPVRIAGVAPPRFQGAVPNQERPVLWLPVSSRAEIARVSRRWLDDSASLTVFARLSPGVSHERASAVARQVVARMLPDSAASVGISWSAEVLAMRAQPPLSDDGGETVAMIAGVGLVGLLMLLVACTNVGSLMVAAAVGRRQEIAVRLSLGASRWRLLRQLLTESTLLAIAGGTAGLVLYWWFATWLNRERTWQHMDLSPDLGTFAFMLAVAIGTGILFGLSPALHATRDGVAGALRDSGMGATRRSRLQRTFVIAQIVLSQPLLVLLAVALSSSWYEHYPLPRALSERVISASLHPLAETGGRGQRREAVDSLIPRIAQRPEVVGVVPEAAVLTVRRLVAPKPDEAAAIPPIVHVEGTAPGYFALLDVPIVLGRDVSLADSIGGEMPVVIGSDLARALWRGENPIGRTIPAEVRSRGAPDSLDMTVVGVYNAARPPTRSTSIARVYTAYGKQWRREELLIRTRGSAESFMPELRRLLRAEAPSLPVGQVATLAHIAADEKRETMQFAAAICGAGALALLVASIGLYGVVSLAVQQRTREIGIRIAVGAKPARVARMFLTSGMRVSAIALLLGLPVSVVGLRVLISEGIVLLENTNVWLIGLCIAIVLLLVTSAATWLPARHAARVDPATTLRVA